MTLKIISTTEVVFEGTVDSVQLPGAMGRFTVLNHHASLVSSLTSGKIVYKQSDGAEHSFDVKGGIADIDNNIVSVCIY